MELDRITINPAVSQGKPSIRHMRFTVAQLLELMAAGMTEQEILTDYSFLEPEDIRQALQFAARMAGGQAIEIKAA